MIYSRVLCAAIAIGDVFKKLSEALLTEPLHSVVPKEYHKWIPVGLSWATRSASMFIAYFVQKIITAAHSALRGAQLIVNNTNKILVRKGFLSAPIEEGSFLFTGIAMVIAASGASPSLLLLDRVSVADQGRLMSLPSLTKAD